MIKLQQSVFQYRSLTKKGSKKKLSAKKCNIPNRIYSSEKNIYVPRLITPDKRAKTIEYFQYFSFTFFPYFCPARKKDIPAIEINPIAAIFPSIYQNISEKLRISIPNIFTRE